MPVPVIIDGYNLLYAQGEAPATESRARLVRDLVAWARARNRRVVLVFDAWDGGTRDARTEAHGPVTVWFTRAGERADAFIVRWVGEHAESVVVTSDRAVQQGARRRGAAVLDADSFAARLEGDAPPPGAGARARGAHAAWLRGL
jgi:predicted RNA-binding protein with PIN domain